MCQVCVSVQKSGLLEVYISDQKQGVTPTSSLGPFFFSVQVCERPRGCRHTSLDVASLGLQCLHGFPQKFRSEITSLSKGMCQLRNQDLVEIYVSGQKSRVVI